MRERVEMLGGIMERRNRSGTTLTDTLPIKEVSDVAVKVFLTDEEKAHELEPSR